MELVILCFTFIFGITIGSFLNVVIYRTENDLDFIKGRSKCVSCDHKLSVIDLFPILSYIALSGKCRYCKSKISSRYPWVELFTGIMFVISFYLMDSYVEGFYLAIYSSILICLSFIDYDTMEIPDFLTIGVLIIGVVGIFLFPEISIMSRLIGAFVISVPMYILNRFIEGAFGEGDVFLIGAVGVVTGWSGTLLAMFIALLIGGSYSIFLLITKKVEKGKHIPFGQYICIGAWIAFCFQEEIISWYLKFLMGG